MPPAYTACSISLDIGCVPAAGAQPANRHGIVPVSTIFCVYETWPVSSGPCSGGSRQIHVSASISATASRTASVRGTCRLPSSRRRGRGRDSSAVITNPTGVRPQREDRDAGHEQDEQRPQREL